MKKILITGGAGFIGSHVVRHFVLKYPDYEIYNLDDLTYAGNLANLADIEHAGNYVFLKGNITSENDINNLFDKYRFDAVIHLAAESHVDRSIVSPLQFVKTNVTGTAVLLEAFRKLWEKNWDDKVFYHVTTDEVYGTLEEEGFFIETTPYAPNSPYSASKAGADHLVKAYGSTYKMPYFISNCSNNYGPNQFPEKLIPLCINNILNNKNIPVYGQGNNTRDWLFVKDHVKAIDLIFHKGKIGQTYNIGGFNEWKNIDLIDELCKQMDAVLDREEGSSFKQVTFIKDRPGHDFRYAIDAGKINKELNWKPEVTFEEGLKQTIAWYMKNQSWLNHVINGTYQKYYEEQYKI